MTRFYGTAAWLCNSLGIALLFCGLVLVPQSRLLADDGGGGTVLAGCSGHDLCNFTCGTCLVNQTQTACLAVGGGGCRCDAKPPPGNDCSGCACKPHFNQPEQEWVCRCIIA